MFVVVDPDSGDIVGPFDSKEEAKAYFIELATQEGWPDVLELVQKTGKPFTEVGDGFVFINSRSENLHLEELRAPEANSKMYADFKVKAARKAARKS